MEGIETAIAGDALGIEDYTPIGGFEEPIDAYNPRDLSYNKEYEGNFPKPPVESEKSVVVSDEQPSGLIQLEDIVLTSVVT